MMMDRNSDSDDFERYNRMPAAIGDSLPRRLLALASPKAYIGSCNREKLRCIIQGTVASMISRKLPERYDETFELDRRYDRALGDFCTMLLRAGTRIAALRAFLDNQIPEGRPQHMKVLFVEAAARRLGKAWTQDSCDFVDVTIGSARLQELILSLSFDMRGSAPMAHAPHALIVTPFSEQHTLMPHLTGLLFDSLGWSRQVLEPDKVRGPLLAKAVSQSDVVCIGWSNVRLGEEMVELVGDIRRHAGSRRLPLIAGGVAALDSVSFLVELGIDCVCDSVYSAARICQSYNDLTIISQHARAAGRTAVVKHAKIEWLAQ